MQSKSFERRPIKQLLERDDTYVAVGHGCRFGLKNCKDGLPLKKPTVWFSTSPEYPEELGKKCTGKHVHGRCMGGEQVTKHAGRYTRQMALAIHRAFIRVLKRKEPGRLRSMLQSVKYRLRNSIGDCLEWNEQTCDSVLQKLETNSPPGDDKNGLRCLNAQGRQTHVVQAVSSEEAQEGQSMIPACGVSFQVPPGRNLPRHVRTVLRKLHINLGHPSVADLKRFLRLGGGGKEVVEACEWLKCSACAQSQRPAIHRTTRIPPHDIQFNDQVLIDCFQVKDAENRGHWFLSVLDRSTMYHSVARIADHSPEALWEGFQNHWVNVLGPPKEVTVDQERGFIGPGFVDPVSKMGSLVTSIAGQAHWQNGKSERHGSIVKEMVRKTVVQSGAVGEDEMKEVGKECVVAKNSLVREHGFSPEQLVFGKEIHKEGELWANGEPVAYHFEVGERGSRLARLVKFRYEARCAFVKAQSQDMLNRTVANRTRPWKEPRIGQTVFFYRENRKVMVSGWIGPALVVGLQGNNVWLTYGSRCFLVAQEHCREAIGEEELFGRPEIQQAMGLFGKYKQGITYMDLTEQDKPQEESIERPPVVGEEMEVDDEEMVEDVPLFSEEGAVGDEQQLGIWAAKQGWHDDPTGDKIQVAYNAWGFRTPSTYVPGDQFPKRTSWIWRGGKWTKVEDMVNWRNMEEPRKLIGEGKAPILITIFHRSRKSPAQLACEDSVPEQVKRRKQTAAVGAVMSQKKAQKALDKEIPKNKIPKEHQEAFEQAKGKEWSSWLKYDSVDVLGEEESRKVQQQQPRRVLPSRFVYRNKHAGMYHEDGTPLEMKAKARLCVAGQLSPDVQSGLIPVDAPTVQRTTFMMFLSLVASWEWIPSLRVGDISNAFLQGVNYEGEPLYMKPPSEGLPGVPTNCLLRLKKPVYGLPEAPRAWYMSLMQVLTKECGFEVSSMDPALFIHRGKQGVDAMIITHVDDLMIASSGTPGIEEKLQHLRSRSPFGEWDHVESKGVVSYCGKEVTVANDQGEKVLKVKQSNFIEGRLSGIPLSNARKREPMAQVSEEEKSDFRSTLGCLQWIATQTRVDVCFEVNQLQKRIGDLRVDDLVRANRLVKEIKQEDIHLTFRPLGRDVAVVAFHDSSLYNSVGAEIEDRDLTDPVSKISDKEKIYSQKGVIVGMVRRSDLEKDIPVRFNVIDWRSKTNRRIVESSFAGETHAAFLGHDAGHFVRVLMTHIQVGNDVIFWDERTPWNRLFPLVVCTDCKSVYDAVNKAQQSIGDRSTALCVSVLRQLASTSSDESKAKMLWLPTRHQIADGLTKPAKGTGLRDFLRNGTVQFHGQSARALKTPKEFGVNVNFAVMC